MSAWKIGDRVKVVRHGNIDPSESEIIGLKGHITEADSEYIRVVPSLEERETWPKAWRYYGVLMLADEIVAVAE